MKRIEHALLFLVLLFLPTQLGRHFWPDFSFIYSLKIDYLSPTVYFWDLLVVSLVIVWVLGKPKFNKLALNLFLFFMLTQVFSLMGTANLGAGLVRAQQYLVAGFFGIYLASQTFNGLKQKIFWPILVAVLYESALAVAQFIKGGTLGFWILGERTFTISTPAIAKFDFYGREFLRPYGTFPHPNVLAGFMIVFISLLSFLRYPFNWIPAFAGMTILLTVSRTAMIAAFIAGMFVLTKKWKIGLVLLILIMSPFLYTRFSSLFNYDQLTFLRREELSLTALSIFLKNPLFGVGLNNFIPTAADALLTGPSRFLQPAHNIFLLTLAETGILGLLGFLGLISYPIFRIFKIRNLLLVWAIILFLGLFDHYFLTLPQGYRLLFLIWGLSLSFASDKIN